MTIPEASTFECGITQALSRFNVRMNSGSNKTYEEEIFFSVNCNEDLSNFNTKERFKERLEDALGRCLIAKSIVVEDLVLLEHSADGTPERIGYRVRVTQSNKIPDFLPANFT